MSKEAMKLALEALEISPMSRKNKDAIDTLREALAEQPAQQALDKMAENARELGLDYEPAQRKDILTLAREAGLIAQEGYQGTGWFWVENNLEIFAEIVRADEREACAMWAWSAVLSMTDSDTADKVLVAIRARRTHD